MLNRRFGWSLLLVAALAACDSPSGPVCTLEARAGIAVTVRNAASGDSIQGALAIAQDGAFVDSARSSVAGLAALAWERPGAYDVSVTKEGFSSWSRSSVRVTRGECHVNTVRLTAQLDSI